MAGMGPPPKDPRIRQRRNRVAGRSLLPAEGSGLTAPRLPAREGGWHPLVESWWKDVWSSPMAVEFLRADTHGLYLIAELREQFWESPETSLAAEIRLQEQRFGLSSLDRRRLQWEVARVEEAEKRRGKPQRKRGRVVGDPRVFLKVVK